MPLPTDKSVYSGLTRCQVDHTRGSVKLQGQPCCRGCLSCFNLNLGYFNTAHNRQRVGVIVFIYLVFLLINVTLQITNSVKRNVSIENTNNHLDLHVFHHQYQGQSNKSPAQT